MQFQPPVTSQRALHLLDLLGTIPGKVLFLPSDDLVLEHVEVTAKALFQRNATNGVQRAV